MRPARRSGYAAGVTDGAAVDWQGLNRASWDDRVPVHLASEFYDLDGFRAGACSLRPFEAAEAGDVTGKRLVHLRIVRRIVFVVTGEAAMPGPWRARPGSVPGAPGRVHASPDRGRLG